MRPAVVFLDFDGLICDTEAAAHQSWDEFYARRGLAFAPATWRRMHGSAAAEQVAVDDLAAGLGRPVHPREIAVRRDRKAWLADRTPLSAGVSRVIDAAAWRDIPVAVVSSSPRPWVDGHLSRLKVRHRLAFVVSGADAARSKPAPDLYVAALERAGVAAEAAIAFEDSPTGVRAARAAGLRCIAVPSSVGCRDDLGDADLVLDSLDDFDFDIDRSIPVPIGVTRP